ncbi:Ras guanine-nucleotide exchange factors catalytic domain [Trinorchestia longiramus]|nr:Ras guanine-nucleotide exchange factors catalytic domain [Trinorchestia longiramus]
MKTVVDNILNFVHHAKNNILQSTEKSSASYASEGDAAVEKIVHCGTDAMYKLHLPAALRDDCGTNCANQNQEKFDESCNFDVPMRKNNTRLWQRLSWRLSRQSLHDKPMEETPEIKIRNFPVVVEDAMKELKNGVAFPNRPSLSIGHSPSSTNQEKDKNAKDFIDWSNFTGVRECNTLALNDKSFGTISTCSCLPSIKEMLVLYGGIERPSFLGNKIKAGLFSGHHINLKNTCSNSHNANNTSASSLQMDEEVKCRSSVDAPSLPAKSLPKGKSLPRCSTSLSLFELADDSSSIFGTHDKDLEPMQSIPFKRSEFDISRKEDFSSSVNHDASHNPKFSSCKSESGFAIDIMDDSLTTVSSSCCRGSNDSNLETIVSSTPTEEMTRCKCGNSIEHLRMPDCSNEYNQLPGFENRNTSESSVVLSVAATKSTDNRDCFQERENYEEELNFSPKCYQGSQSDLRDDDDELSISLEENLSPHWEKRSESSFPSWNLSSSKSESLLKSLFKPRHSHSFDKTLLKRSESDSLNFSRSLSRFGSFASSNLSLRTFFNDNKSDVVDYESGCHIEAVQSGLFDVLEEEIPIVKSHPDDSFDLFARDVLPETEPFYEGLRKSFQNCSQERRNRCARKRRHLFKRNHKFSPYPESCPYFSGGRLGSNNYLAPTWRLWGEERVDGAIYTVYLKKVRYHHPSRSITQEVDDDDISHLEWETVRVWFLKAGTLEKLVESLASSETGELESTFVNVFLATFRTFSTVPKILNLILERYLALSDLQNEGVGVPAHLREEHKKALRLTLQVWLDTYPEDFNDPPSYTCLHQLKTFTEEHLKGSDLDVKAQYKLDKMMREEQERESSLSGVVSCDDVILQCGGRTNGGPVHPSPSPTPYSFSDVPTNVFANQLTRMDMILFRSVLAHQCLGSIWGRRDRSQKNGTGGKGSGRGCDAATVTATVDQFNAVSFRVQSTVLLNTELKATDRAKLLVKWIDVAQELRILKNFSSLKAIISGLQSTPIYRLKKVWACVPKEKCEVYEELARIFSEENNRLNQRELLMREGTAKHAQTAHANDRHLPKAIEKHANNPLAVNHGTIPYLGTFLTDLMMIDTAIPDTVHDGLINFDKKRKEFEVLAQIRLLQGAAAAYQLEPDAQFNQWWDSVLVLDDKELWKLSCLIEPNESASQTANNVRDNRMKKRAAQLGHRKNDSIASTSSGSSTSQFFLDADSVTSTPVQEGCASRVLRKMSTSSTNSSQPSLDASLHSNATTASAQNAHDRLGLSIEAQNSPLVSPDLGGNLTESLNHTGEGDESLHQSAAVMSSCSTHNSLSNTSMTSNSSLSNASTSLSNVMQNSFSNSSGHVSLNATLSSTRSASSGGGISVMDKTNSTPANPYITPDFYIIKVSLENNTQETEGVNLYKSVMVSNNERTASVVKAAMEKHGIEEPPDDYTLAQLLPHGGL